MSLLWESGGFLTVLRCFRDEMVVRVLLQQATSASLRLPAVDELADKEEVLQVGGGDAGQATICFVCFMGEATEEMVAKALKVVTSVKLTELKEGEKRVALTSATSSEVLVVPQATLGGRLKGNSVQYHGNVKVEDGARLYDMFCSGLAEKLGGERVKRGRYGARQILSTITNGPYSHTFDIS